VSADATAVCSRKVSSDVRIGMGRMAARRASFAAC
jgi:hypothetical protein